MAAPSAVMHQNKPLRRLSYLENRSGSIGPGYGNDEFRRSECSLTDELDIVDALRVSAAAGVLSRDRETEPFVAAGTCRP